MFAGEWFIAGSHTDVGSIQETEQVQQRDKRDYTEIELPANPLLFIFGPDQVSVLAINLMLVARSR